jgi:hypothetical protein
MVPSWLLLKKHKKINEAGNDIRNNSKVLKQELILLSAVL